MREWATNKFVGAQIDISASLYQVLVSIRIGNNEPVHVFAIKHTYHFQKFLVISFFNKDKSFPRDLPISFLWYM